MKSKKCVSATLMIILLISLAISGCSKSNNPTSSSTVSSNTVSSSSVSSSSALSSSTSEPVTIQVWSVWKENSSTDSNGQNEAQFGKDNPSIKVDPVVFPNYPAILQKLQIVSAAGEKPDVISCDMCDTAAINSMMPLEDLNSFIKSDSEFDVNDIYPALMKFSLIDGKQLAVPVYTNDIILFYNKKLFSDAGLDPNSPPQTWDEMISDAQKMTNLSKGQYGFDFGFNYGYAEVLTWEYEVQVWSDGGQCWTPDYKQTLFNSAKDVEALQLWVDLFQKYKICSENTPTTGFQNGQVAMQEDGPWQIPTYQTALGSNLGSCLLPKIKVDSTNLGGESIMMVPSNSAKEQADWKFIKYMTSSKVMDEGAVAADELPCRKSAASDTTMTALYKQYPSIKTCTDALQYGNYRMPVAQYANISNIVYKYLQDALYGKMSAQAAMDAATSQSNALLK